MSILKKSVKLDIKMKGVKLSDQVGVLLDEDFLPIDLWADLQKAFGDKTFSISASLSDSEDIDLDSLPDGEDIDEDEE